MVGPWSPLRAANHGGSSLTCLLVVPTIIEQILCIVLIKVRRLPFNSVSLPKPVDAIHVALIVLVDSLIILGHDSLSLKGSLCLWTKA